ncbi:hypothetical protein AB0N87_39025 [Streptomyces sp. NPDC093228]|uniref:hypothetical protein n=1 Tax=Streptomyces sp. NPDC093228 TaxID=3155070 RepID=UPI0034145024
MTTPMSAYPLDNPGAARRQQNLDSSVKDLTIADRRITPTSAGPIDGHSGTSGNTFVTSRCSAPAPRRGPG